MSLLEPGKPAGVPAPKKARILVIDDEKQIAEMIMRMVDSFGFDVDSASGGNEGFQKVLKNRYDCILLDVIMPKGEDGLTFLRQLRSYRNDDPAIQNHIRKISVIVLTGSGPNMRSLFQQEGISDFIEKPFDVEVLKARILKVLSSIK
jgi:CheY-like chemotaxis protein